MKRFGVPALALTAAAALLLGGAGPAAAHRDPRPATPTTLAEGLAGPLTFDVGHRGELYVGQAFTGALTKIRPGRTPVDLVPPTGRDLAAVSVNGKEVTWAETTIGEEGHPVASVLKRMDHKGRVSTVADIYRYEEHHNPDRKVKYGARGVDAECAAQLPPGVAPYKGLVDSHPYGSVSTRYGTYVADAGANAVFKVDRRGKVSTVAVLPPTKVTVTAEMVEGLGLPPCLDGRHVLLESVPTDVEVGKRGELYVSTLPGGPEGELGPLGAVYRVDPRSGAVKLVARGFTGATGLAVAPDGTIYVAELFGGQVSAISRRGKVTPLVELPSPAGVEWAKGRLYVSTDVFGNGSVVKLKVRR